MDSWRLGRCSGQAASPTPGAVSGRGSRGARVLGSDSAVSLLGPRLAAARAGLRARRAARAVQCTG